MQRQKQSVLAQSALFSRLICMVTQVEVCRFCGLSEPVIRFGFNRNGTQRLRCTACARTWSPHGKSRSLSAEKEGLIEKALQERLSQRAIARTLSAGRETVRRVLKKSHSKVA
jgi:transposase-like protein